MKKKVIATIIAVVMGMTMLTACRKGSKTTEANQVQSETKEMQNETVEENVEDLTGHTLMIYCGAGMTKPFQKIADTFQEETGCEINVTFANAGQIQSQITTASEGDLFIAGSQDEVEPVKDYVVEQKDLVKHIPVLAVHKDNPKQICGLADLEKKEILFIMGDVASTPIGKIAKKALTDMGIYEKVAVEATTTTAPQLATAIGANEADAAIVWKENCKADGVEIVDTKDLDNYIKTIPAVKLNCTKDVEALQKFYEYLDTESASQIWTSFGYEIAE